MKVSERRAGKKPHKNGYASVMLVISCIKLKRKYRDKRIRSPIIYTNFAELEQEKDECKKTQTNTSRHRHRAEYLDCLTEKWADEWDLKSSQTLMVIKYLLKNQDNHIGNKGMSKIKKW